jgi:hypothetical protein
VATAFPFAKSLQDSRASMLPGFRFLFAAIMLSMSLLVFGLGAAALLRAAHESFASNSSWRGAPEVTFAQRPDSTLPMLATLRVDAPAAEKASEQAPPVASSVDTAPATPAPAIAEQVAAVRPADAAPAATATSEGAPPAMVLTENPSPATAPPAREATAAGDQTTIAAIAPPSGAGEPMAAPSEPTGTPQAAPDQTGIAKIATLGGPPVDITEDTIKDTPPARDRAAKPDQARDDQSTIKRRVQAKRVVHRRRLSARARLAIQAQQQQANPFAPPPVPATTTRQRQPSAGGP